MIEQVYITGSCTTIAEVFDRLEHASWLAVDCETVDTKDRRCIGIGFAWSPVDAAYFCAWEGDGEHSRSPHFDRAVKVLFDNRLKVWFNGSFDFDVIEVFQGATVNGVPPVWADLAMMSRVQAGPNSLEDCSLEYLGRPHMSIRDILPEKKKMLDISAGAAAFKCCDDVMITWILFDLMKGLEWGNIDGTLMWTDGLGVAHDVTPAMKRSVQLDHDLIPVLRRMGKKGLKLNHKRMHERYEQLAEERFRYLSICKQQFGFEPGSNQQTGYVLASRGNFLPWTKKGKYKTLRVDEDALLALSDPLAYLVLEYRERADQLSDVIEPYLGKPKGDKKTPYKDWTPLNRATTHFRLDLSTSRLASYERNLQNITPTLRDIFEPDDDGDPNPETGQVEFSWSDASQIEMRIFAHLSQDPLLLNAYETGTSVHMLTMEALFPGVWRYRCCNAHKCSCHRFEENPQYTDSKTFNYAMIFNADAKTLAKSTRRPVAQCQELMNRWFDKYSVGHSWMMRAGEEGLARGWVPSLEGRRIRLPPEEQQGERHVFTCAINYRIQPSAAWPIKTIMLEGDKLGYDQRLQVHDEVVYNGYVETPTHWDELIPGISVPMETHRGRIWQ